MNTWEANIRKVVPYTPGEQPNQPDMIKLNTNENPYPPAPGVEKALHGIQPDTLRRNCPEVWTERRAGFCRCWLR